MKKKMRCVSFFLLVFLTADGSLVYSYDNSSASGGCTGSINATPGWHNSVRLNK